MEIHVALEEDRKILQSIKIKWSIENVGKMTLEQYVGVDDRETFVQWVENRTRSLGSINGLPSNKFGLYKRKNLTKRPTQGVFSGDEYTWLKYYGECDYDVQEVFKRVKDNLIQLIKYSEQQNFTEIEKIGGFYNNFKWKVAFLYSNESMIPVFTETYLTKFVLKLGMPGRRGLHYANWHQFLFDKKHPTLSVYNFMRDLFYEDGYYDKKPKELPNANKSKSTKRGRKGTGDLNKDSYVRSAMDEVIVTQPHKELQEKLKTYLELKYPKAIVTFEKNFIDVLLNSDKEIHYYEVKTAGSAEACIKQGLGQLMSYSYYEKTQGNTKGKEIKICVFGIRKANEYDSDFIKYVKKELYLNFEYLSLEEITAN